MTLEGGVDRRYLIAAALVAVVLFLVLSMVGERKDRRQEEAAPEEEFDAFAGGYPVPPMPGQRLPEREPTTVPTVNEEDARA